MGPPLLDLDNSCSCGPEGLAEAEVELNFNGSKTEAWYLSPCPVDFGFTLLVPR